MALLDVNALIALAWDSHVAHAAMRRWFLDHHRDGWATCPVVESGFVRVSTNPKVLPHPVAMADALEVLRALRAIGGHRFLTDDVSPCDDDVPEIAGPRLVTDVHLLVLARRAGVPLVTFDMGFARLAGNEDLVLLSPV
jgi:uncharacterized protein